MSDLRTCSITPSHWNPIGSKFQRKNASSPSIQIRMTITTNICIIQQIKLLSNHLQSWKHFSVLAIIYSRLFANLSKSEHLRCATKCFADRRPLVVGMGKLFCGNSYFFFFWIDWFGVMLECLLCKQTLEILDFSLALTLEWLWRIRRCDYLVWWICMMGKGPLFGAETTYILLRFVRYYAEVVIDRKQLILRPNLQISFPWSRPYFFQ